MSRLIIAIATIAAVLGGLARAQAGIVVTVDKTEQRLTVAIDGVTRYQWPISTARAGYLTPNGSYRPQWLARKWFSRKYDWSPMPYSIFFNEGYAIHGSHEIKHLGRPASHGCIRLHPNNAAVLFALVKARMNDTQIVVTGAGVAPQMRGRGETGNAARNFEDIFGNAPGSDPSADLACKRWENIRYPPFIQSSGLRPTPE